MTTLPFKAVLLGCDQGHYEATTADSWGHPFTKKECGRCKHRLRLLKTVTIRPGGKA